MNIVRPGLGGVASKFESLWLTFLFDVDNFSIVTVSGISKNIIASNRRFRSVQVVVSEIVITEDNKNWGEKCRGSDNKYSTNF